MIQFLIFSLFFACNEKEGDTSNTSEPSGEADVANGEEVYNNTCLMCHPASGDIPTLSADLDDPTLRDIIENGVGGMPAQSSLSDQDVTDVIGYIRTL